MATQQPPFGPNKPSLKMKLEGLNPQNPSLRAEVLKSARSMLPSDRLYDELIHSWSDLPHGVRICLAKQLGPNGDYWYMDFSLNLATERDSRSAQIAPLGGSAAEMLKKDFPRKAAPFPGPAIPPTPRWHPVRCNKAFGGCTEFPHAGINTNVDQKPALGQNHGGLSGDSVGYKSPDIDAAQTAGLFGNDNNTSRQGNATQTAGGLFGGNPSRQGYAAQTAGMFGQGNPFPCGNTSRQGMFGQGGALFGAR